ncbi:MAG: single-stranded-DNA-specific exonuclease RecJ [Elusimicrobia bacterium]|nr:single-stranded-DNA-specific exonuclease RecJ [Elusimicrobiota bacterium]
MIENEWLIQDIDRNLLSELKQQTNLPETVLKVLLSRGFKDVKSVQEFVYPKKEFLYNPFLFEDMYRTVVRIHNAIETQEKILIYADRDVDGVTSLSILYDTISVLGGNVVWYIPSDEGYGLSSTVLDKYKSDGVTLVITVDCGISAVQEVDYANSIGLQVIITDHHEPPQDGLPKAYSVIDAKISSSKYPFKELAGCGVSFKVSQALMQTYGKYFDKKVAVIADDGEKCYIITLVNGIVVSEEEKNLKEIDFTEYTKVFSSDHQTIRPSDLQQEARRLLAEYYKSEFYDDGRMLEFFENNVDLVALGSIADIVPLENENRILVQSGLDMMKQNSKKRLGLSYIFEECLKKQLMCAKSISWYVAPMINAAGRMNKANVAAELLLADNEYKANASFTELKKLNDERKEIQNENVKQFDILLQEQCDIEKDNIFVVLAKDLPHGVTGIVASKIMKLYSKPVILFIEDKGTGEATGSCRSIDGFDIVSALDKTKELLVKFGGHTQAAGVTIKLENMKEFKDKIKQIANETISKEMTTKKFIVDCELKISETNKDTYLDMDILEPFGAANVPPTFLLKDVEFEDVCIIGPNKDHLKIKVCKDGTYINALFWSAAKYKDEFNYKDKFDIVFNMDLNKGNFQLIILDARKNS